MYGYVFRCWVLANVMHPVFFLVLDLLMGEHFTSEELMSGFVWFIPVCLFSFFITLPSLLMGWLVMGILMRIGNDMLSKFCIWLFSIVPIILVNLVLLILLIDAPDSLLKVFEFRKEQVLIVLPSVVSALLASVFCFKQFSIIFYQDKINNHETNLV